nr:putative glutamine amidotransferase PB2B2.05 [Tanacetum cinerariifolium]
MFIVKKTLTYQNTIADLDGFNYLVPPNYSFGDMKEESTVKRKDKIANLEHGEGSLDQIMAKHKSRLEREKVDAVDVDEKKTVHMDYNNYDQHRHAVEIMEETLLHHWFKDSLVDNMEIQSAQSNIPFPFLFIGSLFGVALKDITSCGKLEMDVIGDACFVQDPFNVIDQQLDFFPSFVAKYTYFGPGTVDTIKCHLNVQDLNVKCCFNAIKAFFNNEVGQFSLNQKKQHIFNLLNAKPLEIAFLEFIELFIISTHSYPIQMIVVMPFDDLKFDDNDYSTFGVDISSRLPVDRKSIELLMFAPLMRDSPESIFIISDRCLTLYCTRLLQERVQALPDSCMIPSLAHRLDQLAIQESECLH